MSPVDDQEVRELFTSGQYGVTVGVLVHIQRIT